MIEGDVESQWIIVNMSDIQVQAQPLYWHVTLLCLRPELLLTTERSDETNVLYIDCRVACRCT